MGRFVLQRESDGFYLDRFTVFLGFDGDSRGYSFCFSLKDAFHFKDREDAEFYRSLMHVYVPDLTLSVVAVSLVKPAVKKEV